MCGGPPPPWRQAARRRERDAALARPSATRGLAKVANGVVVVPVTAVSVAALLALGAASGAVLLVAGGVREGARQTVALAEGAAAAVGGAVAGDAGADAAGAGDGGDEQRNPLLQNAPDGAVLTEA